MAKKERVMDAYNPKHTDDLILARAYKRLWDSNKMMTESENKWNEIKRKRGRDKNKRKDWKQ